MKNRFFLISVLFLIILLSFVKKKIIIEKAYSSTLTPCQIFRVEFIKTGSEITFNKVSELRRKNKK